MNDIGERMARMAELLNDPDAIVYVRDTDGRYVWVSDSYSRLLPFTREQVIGKTNRELFGDAARNWEVADVFARGTNDLLTTAEDMFDARSKRWRKFISAKLVIKVRGVLFLCGISVEVKDTQAQAYERQLGQLRARLLEQVGSLDDL